MGALEAWGSLNSLGSLTSLSSLGSGRSGWSMFTWRASGTRSASSSPDAFGALNRAGLGAQGQLHYASDDVTIDSFTGICICFCSFHIALVTNLGLCNNIVRESST